MQVPAPWALLAPPPAPPQAALDPSQLAAALRSQLGVNAPQGLIFGKQPPPGGVWAKSAAKHPSNGAPPEDLAAKLRSQLMSRPDLMNVLEKTKAQIAAESDTDKAKAEAKASAPQKQASDSEIEDAGSWPPSIIRFTPEAIDASVEAARAFEKEREGSGASDSENPEKLVERAAIAALKAMKDQGKLPEEAIVPQPKAEAAQQEKLEKGDEAQEKEETEEKEEIEKKEEKEEKEEKEDTVEEERVQTDEGMKAPPDESPPEVAEASETLAQDSHSLPNNLQNPPVDNTPSEIKQATVGALEERNGRLEEAISQQQAMPGQIMAQEKQMVPAVVDNVMAGSQQFVARREPLEVRPLPVQSAVISQTPVVSQQQHTPAACNFVLNVEHMVKGERVYRYSVGPGTDIDGCFRNVRRRLEMELEDGLTVQMCLQKIK